MGIVQRAVERGVLRQSDEALDGCVVYRGLRVQNEGKCRLTSAVGICHEQNIKQGEEGGNAVETKRSRWD
ncbi:hypothetical protein VNO80_15159 [Phaseolus coccineus]|uniref:Uncharacterized protein n=1 Tax=Phaseolus coccineus TaxID=3886 RepID=A0AAN9QZ23_PHACN